MSEYFPHAPTDIQMFWKGVHKADEDLSDMGRKWAKERLKLMEKATDSIDENFMKGYKAAMRKNR